MPARWFKPCGQPGCTALTTEGRCPAHKKAEEKKYDAERGTAAQRGYGGRWQKIRLMVLREEPLCRRCINKATVKPATDVHHRDGNPQNNLRDNLEPLCHECHSEETARTQGFGRKGNQTIGGESI